LFKPAKGQFQSFYRQGSDYFEYRADFVAETANTIFLVKKEQLYTAY
jgi:type III restriction enzyme